jgi:hypothetical protein
MDLLQANGLILYATTHAMKAVRERISKKYWMDLEESVRDETGVSRRTFFRENM